MTPAKQNSNQTSAADSFPVHRSPDPVQRNAGAEPKTCGYQIDRVIQGIELPGVREIVGTVFQNLLGLIECLDLIESHLRQVDAADESFALFQVIHDEARALVDFIRTDALTSPLMTEELLDTLDGITFALGHDLQRVFEPNPRATLTGNATHVVVGKLYRAHDVLTNCLQQSTITLAMVFDPELVGARLFNNSDMRYRQSLQLCEDISALIQLVDDFEKINSGLAHSNLSAGIYRFRLEGMESLMYSDWPQFESFCEKMELEPAESPELRSTVHQFRCYLETLLGQVRMRNVLANVFPVQFGEVDSSLIATSFADEAPFHNGDQEQEIADPFALAG